MIDHLPTHSFFLEAYADDEDAAKTLAGKPPPPASGPRLAEWTPERDELVRLVDRVGDLIAVTARLHGQKVPITVRPRPVTAIDRARGDARRATHDRLVKRLIPEP